MATIVEGGPLDVLAAFVAANIVVNIVVWWLRRLEEPGYFERAIKPSLTTLFWCASSAWGCLGKTAETLMRGVLTTRMARWGFLTATDAAAGIATNLASGTVADGGWVLDSLPSIGSVAKGLVSFAAPAMLGCKCAFAAVGETFTWLRGSGGGKTATAAATP